MISPRAISAIEGLFHNALIENAPPERRNEVVFHAAPESAPLPASASLGNLTVLGISSYLFRIVALFDFHDSTAGHFAQRVGTGRLESSALQDACGEFINLVCGTVNRNLQAIFPHTGMSTPCVLEGGCVNYLDALNPSYRQPYEVDLDGTLRFRLTLCVCVAAGSNLDFQVDLQTAEASSAGELEFF